MPAEEQNKAGEEGARETVYDQVRRVHKKISEEMIMLGDLLPYLGDEKAYDNLSRVMDFFKQRVLSHFDWEEAQVFPIALAVGELDFKKTIRELQQEHIGIIAKFDVLAEIILKHGFSFEDEMVKNEFISVSREMIEMMFKHARKEDTDFFPYLERKNIKIKIIK